MMMMDASQPAELNPVYDWERYWVPRGQPIVLTHRGYLPDPRHDRKTPPARLVRFTAFESIPCLALLGEPGMGKTSALEAEHPTVAERVLEEGGDSFWLRLRSYTSDVGLVGDLFRSRHFDAWADSDYTLHVFLDDFDECHLRIETLSVLLVDQLRRFPVDAVRNRLRLRIACRTAAWPAALENGLKELWSSDEFGAYELAPLREQDVATAATARGLDSEAFLLAVDRAVAAPLASRPLTLDFLLRLYQQTGGFPSSRAELYAQGCGRLCRETNQARLDSGRRGTFSPSHLLAVAGRIAAATVFAGRYSIVDEDDAIGSRNVLTVEEMAGGSEAIGGEEDLSVGETVVRETMQTALFSGRGPHCVGWTHQTLAEFLAARYLVQRNVALPQVMSLVIHPGDDEAKVAPQLRDVAAWMAAMRADVFREILRTDPQVLLLSDIESLTEGDRADLVAALLEGRDRAYLTNRNWGLRRRYDRLHHAGLTDQLRPYIFDASHDDLVRRVAVDIAEACKLTGLQNELLGVALDPGQSVDTRVNAAYALVEMGDEAVKAELKPLVTALPDDDPFEELKGCGLQATWPMHLTAEELFAVLAAPRTDLLGAYRSFLYRDPTQHLRPSDLPTALAWVVEQTIQRDIPFELGDIITSIVRRGWEHFDAPGVAAAFAQAAVSRLLAHHEVLGERGDPEARALLGDERKRHRVLAAMLPLIPNPEQNLWLLETHGLAESRDVQWLLTRLQGERASWMVRRWALLVSTVLAHANQDDLHSVWELREAENVLREVFATPFGPIPVLRERFSPLFDPIPLGSPLAEKLKDGYQKVKDLYRRNQALIQG